jgi:hypothetical protein
MHDVVSHRLTCNSVMINTRMILILSFALCGFETWSLALR